MRMLRFQEVGDDGVSAETMRVEGAVLDGDFVYATDGEGAPLWCMWSEVLLPLPLERPNGRMPMRASALNVPKPGSRARLRLP